MRPIRDPAILLGRLENGETLKQFAADLEALMEKLHELSSRRDKTVAGSITLRLDIKVERGMAFITADIASKQPKQPRERSLFWVTAEGELTDEFPKQQPLFAAPRVIEA